MRALSTADPREDSRGGISATPGGRVALVAAALILAVMLGYRIESPAFFEDPNDGQYAEVAREMLEAGDWISPQLNSVVFLNKPPLLYWMIATSYAAAGVDERAARLPGTLGTILTFALLYALGHVLFDRLTGLLAVAVYAAMPSTLLEARFVRPDSILVASNAGALLAFAVAARSAGRRQRRALYAWQAALAAGLLGKGIAALLLLAVPVAVVIAAQRRWDLLRVLLAPRSWLLFAALVLPWHVAAALRHEGFLWDYVVQQHLLFFLGRKEPQDSTPISLGVFWAAFLGRTFPWTLLLPPAVVQAARRVPGDLRTHDAGLLLVAAWAVGVLAFFSATTSRMEHYALPALPPVALLVAAALRRAGEPGGMRPRTLRAVLGVMTALFAAAVWLVPALLRQDAWLREQPELTGIAHAFFAILAAATAGALWLARRRPLLVGPIVSAATVCLFPLVHRGLAVIAPTNSSFPVAEAVREAAGDGAVDVVFEAPIEYQHVAGLNFYLRRRITLVEPPGFVAPAYLAPHRAALFIDRAQLAERWQRSHVLLVSDPLAPPGRPLDAIAPQPCYPVAFVANRWILSSRPRSAPGS